MADQESIPRQRRSLHTGSISANSPSSDEVDHSQVEVTTGSKRRSVFTLLIIISIALSIMYTTYRNFPEMKEEERKHVKLPMSLQDARDLGNVLTKYKDHHYVQVLCSVIATYIFLQTFAIPGSLFLTILCGYLFPKLTAMLLVCSCSAIGASLCYGLSQLVGKSVVEYYFPKHVGQLRDLVNKHRGDLLSYILFLRVTPFVPNWMINIASPVVQVDVIPFSLGTFFGVAPPSYFYIEAGTTLNVLTESSVGVTPTRILVLAAAALITILPVILKHKLRKYVD